MKYECPCGYVYDPAVGDPENGIAPGTPFEEIPEDWVCPDCGLDKSAFAMPMENSLTWTPQSFATASTSRSRILTAHLRRRTAFPTSSANFKKYKKSQAVPPAAAAAMIRSWASSPV